MSYKGYEDLSGKIWSGIKYSAKRRGISFSKDLTIQYAWELFIKQNKKCALSGLDISLNKCYKEKNTASLDRINSSKGYSKSNIQWVHKDVNFIKGSLNERDFVSFAKNIYLYNLKKNRLSWPEYFIEIAYIISTRSKDPSTKHGCVLTSNKYTPISWGYNGSFQGINDLEIPWDTRDKLFYITHAEMNALIFAKQSLENCYAFISGIPCSNCCKHLIQAGISKIYYGNVKARMCTQEDELIVRKLCKLKNVELINIK